MKPCNSGNQQSIDRSKSSSKDEAVQMPENVHVPRQASLNKLLVSTKPHLSVVVDSLQDTGGLW